MRRMTWQGGNRGLRLLAAGLLAVCLLAGCTLPWEQQSSVPQAPSEEPAVEPVEIPELTPAQLVEYIEIFHLESDRTREEILAGAAPVLTTTQDTADVLESINFFSSGIHSDMENGRPTNRGVIMAQASGRFQEAYDQARMAKQRFTGHLTAHWWRKDAYVPVEFVPVYCKEIYWFYQAIPEEMLRRIHTEKDGLRLAQYIDLMSLCHLYWDSGFWVEYDGTGEIIGKPDDNGDAGNSTLRQIGIYNDLYWNDPDYAEQKALAESYGLSQENPITLEWVVAHPQQMYELLMTKYDAFGRFSVSNRIYHYDYQWERQGIPLFPPGDEPGAA